MNHRIAFLLLLGIFSLRLHGADIFRWVDGDGRVHYGHSVPESYKNKANKANLKVANPTNAQRQEAEARAAREKGKDNSPAAHQESSITPPSSPTPVSKPANASAANRNCKEEWDRYWKSQECFAPYRQVNGSVKVEAFQHCVDVQQPTRCVPEHQLPEEPARDHAPPSTPRDYAPSSAPRDYAPPSTLR